jgi:hypothetical protein
MLSPHNLEILDPNLDDWVRHPTPPDSPPPAYSRTMRPTRADTSTCEKMSLDFIAPGSRSTEYANLRRSSPDPDYLGETTLSYRGLRTDTPSSPISTASLSGSNSNYSPTRRSARPPSPIWSSYSVSTLGLQPQCFQLRPPTSHRPALPVLSNTINFHQGHPHRIQKHPPSPPPPYTSTQATTRGERPGYCPEGRYAIIYIRGVLNYKWSEVLERFTLLFPPGQVTRCRVTGLPNTYPKRDVQGLQCRWYRIRVEEGLVPLRETPCANGELTPERRVLERMIGEGKVNMEFVWLVENVV